MKLNEVFEPDHMAATKSRDYFLRLMKMYWRGAEIGIWSAGSMIGVEGKLSTFLSVIEQQPVATIKKRLQNEFEKTYRRLYDKVVKDILDNDPGSSDASLLSHEGTSLEWEEHWYYDWVAEMDDNDWGYQTSDMVIPIRKLIEEKTLELFPRGATVLVQFMWPKKTSPEVFDPTVEITVTLAE